MNLSLSPLVHATTQPEGCSLVWGLRPQHQTGSRPKDATTHVHALVISVRVNSRPQRWPPENLAEHRWNVPAHTRHAHALPLRLISL